MKGGGMKHIVLLYVNVAKGTWVTVQLLLLPFHLHLFYLDPICEEWRQELLWGVNF
jgi:hypothetical protein